MNKNLTREEVIEQVLEQARKELEKNYVEEYDYFHIKVVIDVCTTDQGGNGGICEPAKFYKLAIDKFNKLTDTSGQVSLKEVEVNPEDYKSVKKLLIKEEQIKNNMESLEDNPMVTIQPLAADKGENYE